VLVLERTQLLLVLAVQEAPFLIVELLVLILLLLVSHLLVVAVVAVEMTALVALVKLVVLVVVLHLLTVQLHLLLVVLLLHQHRDTTVVQHLTVQVTTPLVVVAVQARWVDNQHKVMMVEMVARGVLVL
jgi:hypothetical protein